MKIAVVCGGVSPEREVSLDSGAAVAKALEEAGQSVVIEDVTKPHVFIEKWKSLGADGVFIALHGGWGENGKFQTCLEAFGIPYSGSGPEASMMGMNKSISRHMFAAAGVPVPEGYTKLAGRELDDRDRKMLKKYGSLIVKPNGGGSTVGVTQVHNEKELAAGLATAWGQEPLALVEQYIPGREITVPVWEKEDGETVAMPAIDIRPKVGFYDYKNKYTHGNTEYICPAKFSKTTQERLEKLAVSAHKSLGCRVYSRVDLRVTEDDDIYALETNTAPGMTVNSLVPMAARAMGMTVGEFLVKVMNVSLAIKRSF